MSGGRHYAGFVARIDPHTHSAASDGTESPTALMRAAAAAGLDVLGLTDHDTWQGWEEAAAAVADTGVALLRGAELSTISHGISVHLLSYLHDPTDEELLAEATAARESRVHRAQRMVTNIARDFELTWHDVMAQATDAVTVGRPHIADALVARGHVADRAAAFAEILHPHGPYYVPYYAPDTARAIRLVRAAGGVPVMAHPRASARGRVVSQQVIADLVTAGLAGLEVYHRDHPPEAVAQLEDLARELGVCVTGARGYHGAGNPHRRGEHLPSPEVLEQIIVQGRLGLVEP